MWINKALLKLKIQGWLLNLTLSVHPIFSPFYRNRNYSVCVYKHTNCLFLPCQCVFTFTQGWSSPAFNALFHLHWKMWNMGFIFCDADWMSNFLWILLQYFTISLQNQAVLQHGQCCKTEFKIVKQLLILVIMVKYLEKAFLSILHFYAMLGIQKTTIIN